MIVIIFSIKRKGIIVCQSIKCIFFLKKNCSLICLTQKNFLAWFYSRCDVWWVVWRRQFEFNSSKVGKYENFCTYLKKNDLFILFSFVIPTDPEPNARDRTLTVIETKKKNNLNYIITIITSLTKKTILFFEQYQHRALPTPITVPRCGTRRRPSRQSLRCLHWIYNDSTTLLYFNIFRYFFL